MPGVYVTSEFRTGIVVFNEAVSKIGDIETIKNFAEANRPNATALGGSFPLLVQTFTTFSRVVYVRSVGNVNEL